MTGTKIKIMKENFFLMNDIFPKNLLRSIYDYNSNEKDLYQVRCRRRIYLKIGCFTEAKNFLVKRFCWELSGSWKIQSVSRKITKTHTFSTEGPA